MITGLDVGFHLIIPGAYIVENFEVTYGVDTLFITPATLTVKAADTTGVYGDTIPAFRSIITGFKYNETLEDIVSGGPIYTIEKPVNSPVSDQSRPNAGINFTAPDSLMFHEPPLNLFEPVDSIDIIGLSNYIVVYERDTFNVAKRNVTFTAQNKQRPYGDPNPTLSIGFTALAPGDNLNGFGTPPEPGTSADLQKIITLFLWTELWRYKKLTLVL
jgi:hypothetical protein